MEEIQKEIELLGEGEGGRGGALKIGQRRKRRGKGDAANQADPVSNPHVTKSRKWLKVYSCRIRGT